MSILVDQNTRLLVQGITTNKGQLCAERMVAGGTHVVAGVDDGHGGEWVAGVPIFDTAREAVAATGANVAIIAVLASQVEEAILEAVDVGLEAAVCITSLVPVWDMVRVRSYLRDKSIHLIGPDSAGVFTPGRCLAGVLAPEFLKPGTVGVVSRSGSLTYESVCLLTRAGFGQSTVVCVGSGLILGMSFIDVLAMFEDDPTTEQVLIVGEIGGQEEERAAEFVADRMSKPVVAFVAGQTSPPGRKMGHAGAMIEGYGDMAQLKMEAFERAGTRVARSLVEVTQLLDRNSV
ncbi:MAG: succinate--CoA ligase subunit alpha [Anaerolineae bacterium]|nr:succinate--CoA ligase subunit alpha [Anaerolineae bacterium]